MESWEFQFHACRQTSFICSQGHVPWRYATRELAVSSRCLSSCFLWMHLMENISPWRKQMLWGCDPELPKHSRNSWQRHIFNALGEVCKSWAKCQNIERLNHTDRVMSWAGNSNSWCLRISSPIGLNVDVHGKGIDILLKPGFQYTIICQQIWFLILFKQTSFTQ